MGLLLASVRLWSVVCGTIVVEAAILSMSISRTEVETIYADPKKYNLHKDLKIEYYGDMRVGVFLNSTPKKARLNEKVIFSRQSFSEYPNIRISDLSFKTDIFSVYEDHKLIASAPALEIMGPLNSLRWLVNSLSSLGEILKEGSLVMPGSPTELISVTHDCDVEVVIQNVGRVSVTFIF